MAYGKTLELSKIPKGTTNLYLAPKNAHPDGNRKFRRSKEGKLVGQKILQQLG